MRNSTLKALKRSICTHYITTTLYRSKGGAYNPETMRWDGNGRVSHDVKVACFRSSARNAIYHDGSGKRLDYDIKCYSEDDIFFDDEKGTQSDIILFEGREYIIVYKDIRRGQGKQCKPVVIFYAKLYSGQRVEK